MFRTHPRVKEFVGSCMKKEVIELSRPELFVSNVELGFKFARIILIIHIIFIIIIIIHIIQQITEQGNECMSEFREMMGGLNSRSLEEAGRLDNISGSSSSSEKAEMEECCEAPRLLCIAPLFGWTRIYTYSPFWTRTPPIRAHPIIGEKNVLQFTLSLIRQFVTLIRSVWSESLQCTMFSARWSSCVCGNMREDPGNKPHLLLALFFAKTILSPFIFVARRYPQSYWILLSFPTISFSIKWLVSNSKSLCLFLCDIQKAVPGFLLVCDPYERGEHYKQPNH